MTQKKSEGHIKWFSELNNKDISIAGGKGASLAEMYNSKFPVPPGFVITAQAYQFLIEKAGLKEKIQSILNDLDIENTGELNEKSKKIRELISNASMPKELADEIIEAYDILDVDKQNIKAANAGAMGILKMGHEPPFVAVRSSATTEDLADASFAGQQETFLNVKGTTMLLKKVSDCFASLFTARAVYYRTKKGFDHDQSYLAVVVQRMVDADKSGVMFSQNPINKTNTIVIESVWGLGEGIVSGQIKPDNYIVDANLDEFKILDINIADKKTAIIKTSSGYNDVTKLTSERSKQQVLTNYEIKILAQYAKQLENHYGKPQDIEFAIEGKDIYIVQSRPITTLASKKTEEIKGKILLSGLGASPGVSFGIVRIIKDIKDLEKIKKGEILVTEMTNPDMVVAMQKSTGIITDEGGITSHAAIVSREMGIPAVVGTNDATKKLKNGEIVTVDGNYGKIYEGKAEKQEAIILPIIPTKIKIKVIVDLPDYASRAAKSGAKAVGLTRLEGIIAESGKHPLKYVKEKRMEDYVKVLVNGLKKITEHFEEVWVRSSDIRSDEYQHLEGAPKQIEGNPMLGDHGIRFSLKNLDIIKAEFIAIKELAEIFPKKIIGLMAPQIISVEEVRKIKEIADSLNMPKNVKIGIMVETPAAVQIINSLCEEGINFISLGTNDLTQFTLAIDRNNTEVQHLYDEMNPAVLNSIVYVIRRCKKYGVETSICGQAASREDMAQFLFTQGIDSISVNADAAYKVSKLISELETAGIESQETEIKPQKSESTLETDLIKVEKVIREVPHIKHLKSAPQPLEEQPITIQEQQITPIETEIDSPSIEQTQSLQEIVSLPQVPPIQEILVPKEAPLTQEEIVQSQLQPPQEVKESSTIQPKEDISNSQDIEEIVLKQLENDYEPGDENDSNKEDIPPLNDAIPIDSRHLEEKEEEEIDLSQEWKGEKRN